MTKPDEQVGVEPVEGDDTGCVEVDVDPGKECNVRCGRVATRGGLCEAHWQTHRGLRDREVNR